MEVGMSATVDDRGFQILGSAADKATKTYLYQAASYVRTTIRRSLGRKSKKGSPPGQPPRSQTGQLKRSILFVVEQHGAVIGAATGFGKSGTAAKSLEHGGPSKIFVKGGGTRTANYEPRPFAAPGLTKSVPKLGSMWTDAVSRSLK